MSTLLSDVRLVGVAGALVCLACGGATQLAGDHSSDSTSTNAGRPITTDDQAAAAFMAMHAACKILFDAHPELSFGSRQVPGVTGSATVSGTKTDTVKYGSGSNPGCWTETHTATTKLSAVYSAFETNTGSTVTGSGMCWRQERSTVSYSCMGPNQPYTDWTDSTTGAGLSVGFPCQGARYRDQISLTGTGYGVYVYYPGGTTLLYADSSFGGTVTTAAGLTISFRWPTPAGTRRLGQDLGSAVSPQVAPASRAGADRMSP